jgi:hypothetical protein
VFRRAVPHVKGMVTGIAMFVAVLIVDVVRVLTPQAFPTWTADVPWSAVALALAFLFAVKLYRRTGKREQAREHLTTATTMYRDMGMTYWLEQAEAEMIELASWHDEDL